MSDTPRNVYKYYVLQFSTIGFPSFITAHSVSQNNNGVEEHWASFVYRTTDLQGDVIERLKEEFPDAHIVTGDVIVSAESVGKPILRVISRVQPVIELPRQWSTVEGVPACIRACV